MSVSLCGFLHRKEGSRGRATCPLCRYQLDWAGAQFGSMSVAQHTAWAQRNGKHEITSYIERGGLPIVIGEWALAGAHLPWLERRSNTSQGFANTPLQQVSPSYHEQIGNQQTKQRKAVRLRRIRILTFRHYISQYLQGRTTTLRRADTRRRYRPSSQRSRRRSCSQAARARSYGRSRTTSATTCGASRVRCATGGSAQASESEAADLSSVRAASLQMLATECPPSCQREGQQAMALRTASLRCGPCHNFRRSLRPPAAMCYTSACRSYADHKMTRIAI